MGRGTKKYSALMWSRCSPYMLSQCYTSLWNSNYQNIKSCSSGTIRKLRSLRAGTFHPPPGPVMLILNCTSLLVFVPGINFSQVWISGLLFMIWVSWGKSHKLFKSLFSFMSNGDNIKIYNEGIVLNEMKYIKCLAEWLSLTS